MAQSSGEIIALTVVFTFLAICTIGLRVLARRISKQPLLADDHLAFASLVTFILTLTVPVIIICAAGNLGNHVSYTPNGMPIVSHLYVVCLFILEFATNIPIALAKLSIVFFYKRLFRGPALEAIVWTLVVLIVAWCISFTLANILQCLPLDKYLTLPQGSPEVHCVDSIRLFYANAGSDVAMDFIILMVPIPFVMKLQMRPLQKLGALAVFATASLAIAVTIAQLVEFVYAGRKLDAGDTDITYVVAPTVYWKMLEGALAIVAICLPSLMPLFRNESVETVVYRVRSALSLHSMRSLSIGKRGIATALERQSPRTSSSMEERPRRASSSMKGAMQSGAEPGETVSRIS